MAHFRSGLTRLLAAGMIAGLPASTVAQDISASAQPDLPGPLEQRAVPITPENPIPRRASSVLPQFPAEETGNIRGTVTLRITLDETGRVAEARQPFRPDYSITTSRNTVAVSPPLGPAFRAAALAAVNQWRYDRPVRAPISFYVRLAFVRGAESQIVWHDARPPVIGQPGAAAGDGPSPQSQGAPVTVGGTIIQPKKVKDVPPVYPSLPKAAGIRGTVIVEVAIGTDGRVSKARVIRSIPLLDQAALDAVNQWEYTPAMVNGQPIPIVMSVAVNFF